MRRIFCKWVVVASVLFVALGCSRTKVRIIRIDSTPQGADVRITSNLNEPNDFLIGITPAVHDFVFGKKPKYGPSAYNLRLSHEGYESKTVTVRKDDTEDYLRIVLDREVVREVPRLQVVITERGYMVEPRIVRAWLEDIERNVSSASNIVRLGDFQSVLGMTLSPDGSTLAFSLAERVKDEQGIERTIANLRAVNTGGGGIVQITSGQWVDSSPKYSTTEDFLYFNSNRLRAARSDIFRISATRTGGLAVIRQTMDGYNYQPAIGGNLVAFTFKPVYQGGMVGAEQIWSIGGENGYPTQLREGSMPAVSPDGKWIAYIGQDKQLWKVPVTGQDPIQLTSSQVNIEGKKNPAWSPDGQYIVYASDDGKDARDVANYDIWIVHQSGQDPRQLTTNGSLDDYPVVSPGQDYIYFVSNRGFKEGIWRIPFPHEANR